LNNTSKCEKEEEEEEAKKSPSTKLKLIAKSGNQKRKVEKKTRKKVSEPKI
jgi:hypothetical protein